MQWGREDKDKDEDNDIPFSSFHIIDRVEAATLKHKVTS